MVKTQQHWQDLDSSHYLHPFTDHGQLSKKGSRVFTKARVSIYGTLRDTKFWTPCQVCGV